MGVVYRVEREEAAWVLCGGGRVESEQGVGMAAREGTLG